MKKFLIVSIVLIVAGLGLILYADPVLTLASGGGSQPHFFTSGGPPPALNSTSGTLPPGCTAQGGGVICNTASNSLGEPVILTLLGIALCGVGLFLSLAETISKATSPYQTKTVT
jgi:hypothetical protein